MKLRPTPIAVGLYLLGLCALPAYADSTSTSTDDDALIQKLSQRTEALENEVGELNTELVALKAKKAAHRHKNKTQTTNTTTQQATTDAAVAATGSPLSGPLAIKQPLAARRGGLTTVPVVLLSDSPLYIGGTPVVTSPYLGIRSQFNASDLIVNISPVNEDMRLLTQKQKLQDTYAQMGIPLPDHAVIDLSGELQATTFYSRPYRGRHTSDIDFTDGELDVTGVFNRWITGFMTVNYDNTPPALGPRSANSRFFMDRGFITVGNLNEFPIYGTAGQIYVPFGAYASNMPVATPLPQLLARTKARAVLLGYNEMGTYNGLNASIFTFRGDSTASVGSSKLNQYGANADYSVNEADWNSDIGVSYINNMADAAGMQQTPASSGFAGFGGPVPPMKAGINFEDLVHRVPGFDIHGNWGMGDYSLLAEYVTAKTNFSPADITYDGHGAKPQAFNAEFAYSVPIFCKPTVFTVGYGQTSEALAFLLPKRRYDAAINISLWRDTIESLEYRHDINYSSGSTATGQGVPVITSGLGNTSDTLSAQISVYF